MIRDKAAVPRFALCYGADTWAQRGLIEVTPVQWAMQAQLVSYVSSKATVHRRWIVDCLLVRKRPNAK